MRVNRSLASSVLGSLAAFAVPAVAQTQNGSSSYYPAPPPNRAPAVENGASTSNLSSPLPAAPPVVTRTAIDSDDEAELFSRARKISWGRYSKMEGATPGDLFITRQDGPVWAVKGRLDSVAKGTEGDWVSIDGVIERIREGVVQIRGEVAFRVSKVGTGAPCKVAGLLTFRRSFKSQVWRLAEGDNPCDGTQEGFDLVMEVSTL